MLCVLYITIQYSVPVALPRLRYLFFHGAAPHPDVQVAEKPSLMKTLSDPGMWAILGLGAAFLVLQFMRYQSMASDSATRAPDVEEELDFTESNSEESDTFMTSA